MRVGLFVPCFVDQLFPEVAVAALRLLRGRGIDAVFARDAACCGQPLLNAGYPVLAAKVGARCIRALSGFDRIVVPSGSCAAMLRDELPEVLPEASDVGSRVREICRFLVDEVGCEDVGARFEARAYLHVGCQLRKDPRAVEAVTRLARAVRGLSLVEPARRPACCGFGGTFSAAFPELSAAIGERTLDLFAPAPGDRGGKLAADVLLSTDPSCLMHLGGLADRRGLRIRRHHLVEVLAGIEASR